MQKSILILFQGDDWKKTNPLHTAAQRFGYETWGDVCEKRNIILYRTAIEWFSGKSFRKAWRFRKGKWEKINKAVRPSVIYDKCGQYDKKTGIFVPEFVATKQVIERYIPFVNDTEFSHLFDNKLFQAVIFSKYLPKSSIVYPGETLTSSRNNPVVLKGFYGSGGYEVSIVTQGKVKAQKKVLRQEFIHATSKGKLQDIRIVFLGNKPIYALTRIAKGKSLYTNFHQGASIEFLDLKKLTSVLALCQKIIEPLSIFPKKIFSLDFLIESTSKKPYMVEINSMPGLDVFSESSKGILKNYLTHLTSYLLS